MPRDRGTILLTGATGFIGGAIARRCAAEGRSFTALLHRPPVDPTEVPWVACDLLDRRAVAKVVAEIRPTACLHAAWHLPPDRYRDDPANDAWVDASLHLASVLASCGASWFGAFGTCIDRPQVDWSDCRYARAKSLLRSSLARFAAAHPELRCAWLRLFQPFGPGEPTCRFLPSAAAALSVGSTFLVRAPNDVRDFTHVDRIAEQSLAALDARGTGTIDLGTGEGTTLADAARIVARAVGADPSLVVAAPTDARPVVLVADRPNTVRADFASECAAECAAPLVADAVRVPTGARRSCPVCSSRRPIAIDRIERQPILMNRLYATREEALAAPTCTVDLVGCAACGFVWNAAFDPKRTVYGPGYVNDQSGSAVFRAHLDRIAAHLADLVRDARPDATLVEVGCGQGGFLRMLASRCGRSAIGFDPALSAPSAGRVALVDRPFDAASLDALRDPIALVFSRHVLEHLPDPGSMLATMVEALAERGDERSRIFVEVPSFAWIAREGTFFDCFNEHCSLFSPRSMRTLLERLGLASISIEPVFDGQYLAATAQPARAGVRSMPSRSPSTDDAIGPAEAGERLRAERARWKERLDRQCAEGPVVVWGGAAKGVGILTQLGIDATRIPWVVDINPAKQGRFVPITGQEIVAPDELPALLEGRPAVVVVMNPTYEHEIAAHLDALGIDADIDVPRCGRRDAEPAGPLHR
jgi:nucleoside-diphosphate-sugar epimerase